MALRPPAPYPDGTPEDWAKIVLEQGVRGEGSISRHSDGDYVFLSGRWQTIHGPARVVRSDSGAYRIWGALLPDGRRVHCRRSPPSGLWRRRSDDGRSWVIGKLKLAADEVWFEDGSHYRPSTKYDENVFEKAMASQPHFIKEIQDDSFAFTLKRDLWVEALCTMDGTIGWSPSRGAAGSTIAKLRGFGEDYLDFKAGPYPEPPLTERSIILEALATAGWRYQTDEEYHRLNP